MPEAGWKSISIPEEVYDFFQEEWERNKEAYKKKYDVKSFSGFVSKLLSELIKREKEGTLPESSILRT